MVRIFYTHTQLRRRMCVYGMQHSSAFINKYNRFSFIKDDIYDFQTKNTQSSHTKTLALEARTLNKCP